MADNPAVTAAHALYTTFAFLVDNISTIAAVLLFTLQFIVIAPKAWKQIQKWRGKDDNQKRR
jgi:hypothetical protein